MVLKIISTKYILKMYHLISAERIAFELLRRNLDWFACSRLLASVCISCVGGWVFFLAIETQTGSVRNLGKWGGGSNWGSVFVQ